MFVSRWLFALMALSVGCAQARVRVDSDAGVPAKPNVLLLLDTSGSMAWKSDCTCESAGCANCVPDCNAGERPRWHEMLAAISGSYEHYNCEAEERVPENGATYDLGYTKPMYKLGASVDQLSDGLLDRYGDKADFGVATFDSMRTYTGQGDIVPYASFDFDLSAGAEGEFSYAGRMRPDGTMAGKLAYPNAQDVLYIDTGIVNSNATEGALILPRASSDTIPQIKDQLRGVRLYGGTPTTSALDDLYFAFAEKRASSQTAKSYILFITDGSPDDDFRDYPTPGCDCAQRGNCPQGTDPAAMMCPYPTAVEAARHLHCGFDATRCAGSIAKLEVVTYSIDDPPAKQAIEAIATSGNGAAAHATNPAELVSALDAAMSRILADATNP